MAIVLISSQKRQKIFLWSIATLSVLILSVIPLIIFSSWFINQPKNIIQEGILRPDLRINFNIIDSDQVEDLEPFSGAVTEFTYVVEDKNGRQLVGRVLAVSQDDAKALLEGVGLKVFSLQETNIGREEPFVPY